MNIVQRVHNNHIGLMQKTVVTIGSIIKNTDVEVFKTLRDGPDGWTCLEVLCHLKDFNRIFFDRMVMMMEQDEPLLPAYDHDAMAIDLHYNEQDRETVFAELHAQREELVAFLKNLTDEQWQRTGTHPERDYPFTMTDAVMQVGHHDLTHIEQITRILVEGV